MAIVQRGAIATLHGCDRLPFRRVREDRSLAVLFGVIGALGLAGGCKKHRDIDREKAKALFTEVTVDTAPGLSGLSTDESGELWTVSERDAKAYLITLGPGAPKLQTFDITGIPPDTDLEAIARLSTGKLAFGTEGQDDGVATILLGEERGPDIQITGSIALPEARLGLRLSANHGTEGLCGAGTTTMLAAIEEVGTQDGKRWAPIVQIERGEITQVHKLWLTTETGKLSGLDCHLGADGSIRALAIERHFEVTRLLTFVLPAARDADIVPHVALDLSTVLNGKLNLEGIVWDASGRVIVVIDNQYTSITGPSELLVFRPNVVN